MIVILNHSESFSLVVLFDPFTNTFPVPSARTVIIPFKDSNFLDGYNFPLVVSYLTTEVTNTFVVYFAIWLMKS